MLSATERSRLLKAMSEEPVYVKVALAKCALGLAVFAMIAVIGASQSADSGAAGNVAADYTTQAADPAQAHRKELFDERRARLENGDKRNNRKIEVVDLPKDLPMELL